MFLVLEVSEDSDSPHQSKDRTVSSRPKRSLIQKQQVGAYPNRRCRDVNRSFAAGEPEGARTAEALSVGRGDISYSIGEGWTFMIPELEQHRAGGPKVNGSR